MILDLRYHIFTITAIFAALGLGILIGTSVIGNEGLIEEQNKIISNIGDSINKLKAENSKLKNNINKLEEKLEYRKEMETRLLSLLLGNKFSGNKYVLFSSGRKDVNKVKELLNDAGAELKIKENINNNEKIEKDSKIIYWDTELNKYREEVEENAVLYTKPDVMGLILTLMESEKNEKDKKECIDNNTSS